MGFNPQHSFVFSCSFCFSFSILSLSLVLNLFLSTGNLSLVHYLLEHHYASKRNDRESLTGNTILHVAAMFRGPFTLRHEAIGLLLDKGVDPLTKNRESKTALDCLPLSDISCQSVLHAAIEQKSLSGQCHNHRNLNV